MRFDDPEDVGPRQTGGIQFFGGVDWLFDKTGHYYLPDDMPGSPGVNERTREREIQRADYWHNVRTAEDLLIIPFGYVLYRILRACLRSCFGRRQHRHQQVQGPTFWDRAKLSLLGPTTVHLRYECALILCNALLTSAALVSIYRGGFGSLGDFRYVALTVLVMSRHVALRWLCLNDTSTSSHPTVMGTIAKILSTFCAAGQVFDSPPSSVLMTSDQHEMGGYGKGRAGRTILIRAWCRRLVTTYGISYGNRSRYSDTSTGSSSTSGKSSGSGTQHARKKSGGASSSGGGGRQTNNFSSDRESAKDDSPLLSNPIAYIRSYAPELAHKLATFREKYVPPTQKCVWLGTLLLIAVGLHYFYQSKPSDGPVEGYPGAGGSFDRNGLLSQTNPQNHHGSSPKQVKPVQHDSAASEYGGFGSLFGLGTPGARHRSGGPEGHDPPSFVAMVFHLSWIMTVASLLIFGRVFLPAPDLAVSTSAQKAIRADIRHHGGGGGGGSGGKHGSKSKHHSESIPWAEQYYSINADNRFRLHCRVIFLRLIENVLLCVIIPHTEFACIAAGHCSPNPYVWDLPGYLGVASSRNRVGGFPGSMYEDVVFDKVISVVLALTIVIITGAILMSQVVALDRSCLASMGYMNEEINKRPDKGSGRSGGRNRDRRTGVADIDPFRDNNFLKNIYSRLMWRIFRYEVGHPSKSRATAFACVALLGCFGMNILVLLAYFVAKKDLAASVLTAYASYKATRIMAIDGTTDREKMRSLAAEMQSA